MTGTKLLITDRPPRHYEREGMIALIITLGLFLGGALIMWGLEYRRSERLQQELIESDSRPYWVEGVNR